MMTHVGELMFTVMKQQFEWLRDGDCYWYAERLSGDRRAEIESTTLADIIRRNTELGDELGEDVFHVSEKLTSRNPASWRAKSG